MRLEFLEIRKESYNRESSSSSLDRESHTLYKVLPDEQASLHNLSNFNEYTIIPINSLACLVKLSEK